MNLMKQNMRRGVREAYSKAASHPDGEHPFPTGRKYAEALGYSRELLDSMPESIIESFTGVSTVSLFAKIPEGASVLDLGCGAGLDSQIAAKRVGQSGTVLGIDFSAAMVERASRANHYTNLKFLQASGEELPIEDGSIDVVLINGIFNLNPARAQIFQELGRVVRSGASVYAAELVLKDAEVHTECSLSDWFS